MMIVIANVFQKSQNVQNLLRSLAEKRCFRTRFDSQHMKTFQILAKSPGECFYHVFSSFSGKFISKMSLLVLGEILGVFVNTLTADVKYAGQDCKNLQLPIKMVLSGKRISFSGFFVSYLESISNFKHFVKKDDWHS